MIRYLSNNKSKVMATLVAIPLLLIGGYYLITPRVIVSNLSDVDYDELVISLPASRISFSPVEADSTGTIYFSRQGEAGTSSYSLLNKDGRVVAGSFQYLQGNELGRVLRFTIENNGVVSFGK